MVRKTSDGEGPVAYHPNHLDHPRGPEKRLNVKKKEQNLNSQLSALAGRTFMHKRWLVELVEREPGGITSCTTHPWKAQDLSFPTSPLELI